MADPVELGGREGEVAAGAAVTHQAGCSDPTEALPQPLIGGEQLGGDRGGHPGPLGGQPVDLAAKLRLGTGGYALERLGFGIEAAALRIEVRKGGLHRLQLAEHHETLFLELGSPCRERLDLCGHRLQVARSRHASPVEPGGDLPTASLGRSQLGLELRLAGDHLAPRLLLGAPALVEGLAQGGQLGELQPGG